jgi:hypothetical protein
LRGRIVVIYGFFPIFIRTTIDTPNSAPTIATPRAWTGERLEDKSLRSAIAARINGSICCGGMDWIEAIGSGESIATWTPVIKPTGTEKSTLLPYGLIVGKAPGGFTLFQ